MPESSIHTEYSRAVWELAKAASAFACDHEIELKEFADAGDPEAIAFVRAMDVITDLSGEHHHQQHVDDEFRAMTQQEENRDG